MVNSLNIKNALLIALISTSIIACNKKEETPEPEPVNETPTVTCFNSQNNGTYHGSGITTLEPFISGTLTVTRTSCQVVNLNLTTDSAGQVITQASQLTLNSSGGYDGKQTNNNNISLTFGSSLSVNAIGSFTFTGIKQP
jgi:hypothetical protein